MYELFNKSGWLTDADDIPFITGNAPRKVPPNQRRYSAKEIEEMFCMSVNEKIAAYEKKQREDHSWALEMANAFMKGEEEKMAQLAQARQVPKKLPVAPKKAPVASKKGPVKTATVPKPTKVVKLKDCEVHTYDWDELA